MSKIKTASFLGFVAIVTGFLNYLTHPILIAYLPQSDYVQTMVYSSIIAIISIPSTAFGYVMLELFRSPERQELIGHHFFKKIQKLSFYHGIFLLIVLGILLWLLNIPLSFVTILVFIALFPSLFVGYFGAYIQSRELFYYIGFFSLASSFSRMIVSLLVGVFPSALLGAFVFIAPVFTTTICYIFFGKKFLRDEKVKRGLQYNISLRSIVSSFFGYIIISAVFILLQYCDNILAKILFPVADAASYMAAGVLVKFSLVIMGIIETLSLPVLLDKTNPILFRKYFLFLLILMIIGFLISVSILPFLGNLVLGIIKNGMSVSYVVWSGLGISMVSLGFFSIFAKILIAQKIRFYYIFILPILFSFFFLFVSTIENFIMVFSCVNMSLLAGVLFLMMYKKTFPKII